MPFNTPKSIRKRGGLEKVACPQCGRYVATGRLSRHISHADGHSIAFFGSNVSAKSVTNNKGTSETFADFSDAGFLGNAVVDVNRIKCGVHLIPNYGNTLCASETEVPVGRFGPEVFQHFEEFFLNSWIDIYQYNSIY